MQPVAEMSLSLDWQQLFSCSFHRFYHLIVFHNRLVYWRLKEFDNHQDEYQCGKQKHQIAVVLQCSPTAVGLARCPAFGQDNIAVPVLLEAVGLKYIKRYGHCRCRQAAVEINLRGTVCFKQSIVATFYLLSGTTPGKSTVDRGATIAAYNRLDMIATFAACENFIHI